MSSLFDDLSEGLKEVIEAEKGNEKVKKTTFIIKPVKEFNSEEIKQIRTKAGMTQNVFASYMGVSKKTVEAWECGRTHPTGPAYRLLDLLYEGKSEQLHFLETV